MKRKRFWYHILSRYHMQMVELARENRRLRQKNKQLDAACKDIWKDALSGAMQDARENLQEASETIMTLTKERDKFKSMYQHMLHAVAAGIASSPPPVIYVMNEEEKRRVERELASQKPKIH